MILVLQSDCFGRGDESLGRRLMGAFLKKLWANPQKPQAIIFYNSAVKLLTKAGGQLEALEALHSSGVDLIACGTCIDYFELKEALAVGRVSGMEEIVSLMMSDEKVTAL